MIYESSIVAKQIGNIACQSSGRLEGRLPSSI